MMLNYKDEIEGPALFRMGRRSKYAVYPVSKRAEDDDRYREESHVVLSREVREYYYGRGKSIGED